MKSEKWREKNGHKRTENAKRKTSSSTGILLPFFSLLLVYFTMRKESKTWTKYDENRQPWAGGNFSFLIFNSVNIYIAICETSISKFESAKTIWIYYK